MRSSVSVINYAMSPTSAFRVTTTKPPARFDRSCAHAIALHASSKRWVSSSVVAPRTHARTSATISTPCGTSRACPPAVMGRGLLAAEQEYALSDDHRRPIGEVDLSPHRDDAGSRFDALDRR